MIDTERFARRHGLRWISDADPGWSREPADATQAPRGERFVIRDAQGGVVRDAAALARVRRLAIPPAWQDVWICAEPDGHLQATGRDARGRKQYRYHPDWEAGRGETRFAHLSEVAHALPPIRRRVEQLLAERGAEPTRERVVAALVRLLDTTWLRIGNDAYARENGSYGLSTLRDRHADVGRAALRLSFVGKGGARHVATLEDERVARIVRHCRELPGQELFQWVDERGGVHRIDSADVNGWLAEVSGSAITAKDFRTWHASVLALALTLEACADDAPPTTPRQVVSAVAQRLGNTAAICRKAYVHPDVLALATRLGDASARAELRARAWATDPPARRGLQLAERRLLGLLSERRSRRRWWPGTVAASAAHPLHGAIR